MGRLARILQDVLKRDSGLDRIFDTVADPTRRTMIERLTAGPATVSELAAPTALSLAGVMAHLKVLEDCGLVSSQKIGRVRTCTLETGPLRQAEAWLAARRTAWESRLDRLADALTGTDAEEKGDD